MGMPPLVPRLDQDSDAEDLGDKEGEEEGGDDKSPDVVKMARVFMTLAKSVAGFVDVIEELGLGGQVVALHDMVEGMGLQIPPCGTGGQSQEWATSIMLWSDTAELGKGVYLLVG